MREIKFRAWVGGKVGNINFGETYRMEYNVTLFNGAYASFVGGCEIYGEHPEVPLMQYTGLKDKNGKEIYEGDIIGSSKSRSTGLIKDIWTFEWLSIEMEDGEMKSGKNTLDRFHHLKDMEGVHRCSVIGNVYEDPELLADITSDKTDV